VLASLARSYAMMDRMEESNEWRNPIDAGGGEVGTLIAALRRALLREDCDFHTIQNFRGGGPAVFIP